MVRRFDNTNALSESQETELLQAARNITGWSVASMSTKDTGGQTVTRMKFAWRGGFLFPEKALKVDGVARVHSYVKNGTAEVWVTWWP